MTTNAKKAMRMGPIPYSSSSVFLDAEFVATLRVTFLSKREVALRRRAALFPFGMIGKRINVQVYFVKMGRLQKNG